MPIVIHKQEFCAPRDLRPDPDNARTHSKKQIAQVVAAIREFGFTNPILVDERGLVIAGHARLRAATELGLAQVPIIRIAGLSDARRRALALADNKIALNAGWDSDVLQLNLEIISQEIDVEITGFSVGEVDVVLSEGAADPDDDAIPAAPARPITCPGDIWECGAHVIGCGDARDLEFLRRVVGSEPAAAMFSDPPYNVPIDGHVGGKGKIKHREFAMGVGEMSSAQFIEFLIAALGPCVALTREGGVHFICMDHRHIEELTAATQALYGERLNICVWNKSNAGMGGLYRSKHELVFVCRVGDAPHRNNVELGRHGRNRTNVWDYPSVNSLKGSRRHDLALHPTVKPVKLVADAIVDVTKRGEIVLDTFLGSGTTLIACERSGRRFRGLELDPAYVDVALERWRIMTGGAPVRRGELPIKPTRRRRARHRRLGAS